MTHDQTVAHIADLLERSKKSPVRLDALDKAVMSLRDEDVDRMKGQDLTTRFILQRRRKIFQKTMN